MALAPIAGLALRLWMLSAFPQVNGDSLIYGGLAKNLLLHGVYAITDTSGVLHPTLIRLPGYPLLLAACFRLFGMEHYTAVMGVQIALELAGCLLLADFARRLAGRGAALCTLWLGAVCPFTAVYCAAPLTETATLFSIAAALWAMARFAEKLDWASALVFTAAITYAALLRPDGALVGVALAPAVGLAVWRRSRSNGEHPASGAKAPNHSSALMSRLKPGPADPIDLTDSIGPAGPRLATASGEHRDFAGARGKLFRIALVCFLLAMTPFAAWTVRNWQVFHVFEPLAPRYATDPGEDTYPGWQRWVKTWCLDFVSTYSVYWNVPGDKLDLDELPSRAFDSPAQRDETAAIVHAYDENGQDISPEIDAGFARLAAERIAAHPLRYYAALPLGRFADMLLRPRVENLPIDLDWWVYAHHWAETRFSWFYAGLNAVYLLLGIAGLCLRPRFWPWMLGYFVLRGALLATLEAPEARYTLEYFPMLFALGGIALYRVWYSVWRSVLKVKASAGSG